MQIFCAAVSLYHSWMHRGSSTSHTALALISHAFCMFWCCLHLAHSLSILCPIISCPCPSWNDHSLWLMQCPGHYVHMSNKLSVWSLFGHALGGHLQLSVSLYNSHFTELFISSIPGRSMTLEYQLLPLCPASFHHLLLSGFSSILLAPPLQYLVRQFTLVTHLKTGLHHFLV